jgi:hypothetical protein
VPVPPPLDCEAFIWELSLTNYVKPRRQKGTLKEAIRLLEFGRRRGSVEGSVIFGEY